MKNAVLVYDKELGTHVKKTIYRTYTVLGKTPEFDPAHKKSYMFSDSDIINTDNTVFQKYERYIEKIKQIDPRYNQFVINVYKNGSEFIEPHSDCDKDMIEGYSILIWSFGQTRTMRFTSRIPTIKGYFDVELRDCEIFTLNKFLNTSFRHEILKDGSTEQRVSITARMMK